MPPTRRTVNKANFAARITTAGAKNCRAVLPTTATPSATATNVSGNREPPATNPNTKKKFGANLIWWSTQDSAFENWATLEGWDPRARRVDNNVDGEGKEDLVWGEDGNNQGGPKVRDRDLEIQPTGDITNGLIRVGDSDPYRNSNNPGRATLGEELKWENGKWVDHHNTKTRIFGHYHLAWADQEKGQIQPVSLNSYSGARSFVAQVKNKLAVSSK